MGSCTIRSVHAGLDADTEVRPVLVTTPRQASPIAAVMVTIGDDLSLAFGEALGGIPERVASIDPLLNALATLRERLELEGEQRFEELADLHDAAHDDGCTCLTVHGRTYLLPLVGERVPEDDQPDAGVGAELPAAPRPSAGAVALPVGGGVS